jgi:hypothetical protein
MKFELWSFVLGLLAGWFVVPFIMRKVSGS